MVFAIIIYKKKGIIVFPDCNFGLTFLTAVIAIVAWFQTKTNRDK